MSLQLVRLLPLQYSVAVLSYTLVIIFSLFMMYIVWWPFFLLLPISNTINLQRLIFIPTLKFWIKDISVSKIFLLYEKRPEVDRDWYVGITWLAQRNTGQKSHLHKDKIAAPLPHYSHLLRWRKSITRVVWKAERKILEWMRMDTLNSWTADTLDKDAQWSGVKDTVQSVAEKIFLPSISLET